MLRPYLFVGVGGSGGQTLRYLHREMERRLRDLPDGPREIPEAWQFLHIDVPAEADGFENKEIPAGTLGGPKHYLNLTEKYDRYHTFHDAMDQLNATEQALAWRPRDPAGVSQIWLGAKQQRAVGRTVVLARLARVNDEIEGRKSHLTTPGSMTELMELAKSLGTSVDRSPQAILVGSLGGGAGSGMFLDLMEIIRSSFYPEEPISFLYAPDVFQNVPGAADVAANSLAAVAELVSGFESSGPLHPSEDALLNAAGVGTALTDRRSFAQNMLVCASNPRGFTLPNPADVFRVTGKAMSAFVLNPSVAAHFGAYLTANQEHAVPHYDQRTLSDSPRAEAPFLSFGYASCGLGRALFNEYAAQRLTSAVRLRIQRGHVDDAPLGEVVDEDAMLERKVKSELQWFLGACGLNERTNANNQVIDALRDNGTISSLTDELQGQLYEKFFGQNDRHKATEMLEKLEFFLRLPSPGSDGAASEQRAQISKLRSDLEVELRERARAWSDDVQTSVLDAAAEAVARHGARTATALVESSISECRSAADELRRSAADLESGMFVKRTDATGALTQLGGDKIGANHDAVRRFFHLFGAREADRHNAQAYRLAAKLLDDVAGNLLPPLGEAIALGFEEMIQDLSSSSDETTAKLVAGFPTEASPWVPDTLRTAPNERVVIDQDDYPAEFARVAQIHHGYIDDNDDDSTQHLKQAVDQSLEQIMTGRWKRDDQASSELPEQDLLRQTQRWVPAAEEIADLLGEAPQRAEYRINLRLVKVMLPRAREWVKRVHGAFGDYAKESLRDHLAQYRDRIARGDRFILELKQALELAHPLIEIDDAAHQQFHVLTEGLVDLRYVMTPVPLQSGTDDDDIYEQAVDAVASVLGVGDGSRVFDSTFTGQEIEIAAFLGAAIGPASIGSYTEHVLASWNERSGSAEGRYHFWENRRTRRLGSFVPMTPDRQEAFLRGWFTGQLLGYIDVPEPADIRPADWRVWAEQGWQQFSPAIFGGYPRLNVEVPFALLETLPLAMVMASRGDMPGLEAYNRVLDLGAAPADAGGNPTDGYPTINAELAAWITTGQTAPGAPTPPERLAGSASGSSAERLAEVRQAVERYLATIAKIRVQTWEDHAEGNPKPTPRFWEMGDEAHRAIASLSTALAAWQDEGSAPIYERPF